MYLNKQLTSSGSLRPARMLPFSLGLCLLGLFRRGEVSRGGGGGGGGGATFSLEGEIVSSNQRPKMGSLSSSGRTHWMFSALRFKAGTAWCIHTCQEYKINTWRRFGGWGDIKMQVVSAFKLDWDTYKCCADGSWTRARRPPLLVKKQKAMQEGDRCNGYRRLHIYRWADPWKQEL